MLDLEKVFLNGRFYTMDREHPRAEAVGVIGDRIAAVGSAEMVRSLAGKGTECLDLGGKVVLPGLIDAHVHFMQTGLDRTAVYLNRAGNIPELLRLVAAQAGNIPEGGWVRGYGYDETKLDEKRVPSLHELDAACPGKPMFLSRVDAHSCLVNSAALKVLDLDPDLEGTGTEGGTLSGNLKANANSAARVKILNSLLNPSEKRAALVEAAKEALSVGVTTVHALEGGSLFGENDFDILLSAIQELPVRVVPYHQIMDVERVARKGLKRIGGCITVDGSIGSRTAALLSPYEDQNDCTGCLYIDTKELEDFVIEAHRRGMQIAMHTIGDAAIEQLLRAYEKAVRLFPRNDHRHRFEHFSIPTDDQINRAGAIGCAICVQPSFDFFTRKMMPVRLGEERFGRSYPLRTLLEAGLLVAGGSDSSITPLNPMLGVYGARCHTHPYQRLEIYEGIKLFTLNAAAIAFEEMDKGSITVGKLADMAVVSEDPFSSEPEHVKDIQVDKTILGGQVVYSRSS